MFFSLVYLIVVMEAVKVHDADVLVVLAKDEGDASSDGLTFDTLHRISDLGAKGTVLAECVDDRNRERLMKAGADIVIRPMRAYPGLIVRSLVARGSEQIFERVLLGDSDEYTRFDVDVTDTAWRDIVCALIMNDLGTAVAYVDRTNNLHCNPAAGDMVDAAALIVMVSGDNTPSLHSILDALEAGNGS